MPHGEGGRSEGPGVFVGRERELDRLATLLVKSAPLITVVGAGGIGKTRLVTDAVRRYRRARLPGRSSTRWCVRSWTPIIRSVWQRCGKRCVPQHSSGSMPTLGEAAARRLWISSCCAAAV
ncbi:AAA family ATPase [Nocardia transvalensis]|uniref:AAA family ATPase n=1 Tax=Nocardia transvalensis TaxID=37333 RepID=UPI000A01AF71